MCKYITWEEFETVFKPVPNVISSNASCNGWLFETYGCEKKFVLEVLCTHPCCVWTVVDDGDDLAIVSGVKLINRMGYVITSVPYSSTMHDGDIVVANGNGEEYRHEH